MVNPGSAAHQRCSQGRVGLVVTGDRANRLRQLREKETLTPEEESELNELRRQVNEDLLSKGGPLEAQRERYADLMQRFLASRQSELTQDGD